MSDATALPQDLLRIIFEQAAQNTMPEKLATAVTLCSVSRATREWILPVLYRTVCISVMEDWERFARTVIAQPGFYAVRHLSVLMWPAPPSGAQFSAVVRALPSLRDVQIAFALVPFIPPESAVESVFVSKHGPLPDVPLVTLPNVRRLFVEPFYTGLYPAHFRSTLPTLFEGLTHFGMAFVLSNDDVSRDLIELVRDMLSLPGLQHVYIRILAQTLELADDNSATMRGICRPLHDGRVRVGGASIAEWGCPPGQERVSSSRSLWISNALARFDMWTHGPPAYP